MSHILDVHYNLVVIKLITITMMVMNWLHC